MSAAVVLVGPMGAGKSTIGRILAGLLQRPFADSDKVIEERTGADIPWIFDVEGEEGFRTRETGVLKQLLDDTNLVLATGGGIVMREENRELLQDRGWVVYLTAGIEKLIERTAKDKKRPLLQVENPAQKIRDLIEQRHPLYEAVADFTICTDGRGPKAVAQAIAKQVKVAGNES